MWKTSGRLLQWRTQPTPGAGPRPLERSWGPHGLCEESIRTRSTPAKAHCPQAGWNQRHCKQLPRTTPPKRLQATALQPCLPGTSFWTARWCLPPSQHPVWMLLLKGATSISFREKTQYSENCSWWERNINFLVATLQWACPPRIGETPACSLLSLPRGVTLSPAVDAPLCWVLCVWKSRGRFCKSCFAAHRIMQY